MNLQTTGTGSASGKRVITKGLTGFVKLLLIVYAILTLYPLYWLLRARLNRIRISSPTLTACRRSG